MYYSIFEVYSVGIGPSSSHSVGPMRAAKRYVDNLIKDKLLNRVAKIDVYLYGSLALTGVGHGTLNAAVYGLMGLRADNVDITKDYILELRQSKKLLLEQTKLIDFDMDKNIILQKDVFLPEHSNGMKFVAFDKADNLLLEEVYFSVGGGTIVRKDEFEKNRKAKELAVPYPFGSYNELAKLCKKHKLSIAELVLANEASLKGNMDAREYLTYIYNVMDSSIKSGVKKDGYLPGGLNLKRRASSLRKVLMQDLEDGVIDTLVLVDWINVWAFAVAEENASGGRVVTAPTMGSAGILPAVLRYFEKHCVSKSPYSFEEAVVVFLATASAICSLYRTNASISGAEVGCQGEVGVACSMAAAGLVAALGGDLKQIENAAEIAMEHNLGLTCDPINGLVQVPCIERNAVAAVKAVTSSRLGMMMKGNTFVSLDEIINTMYETGLNLSVKYKETSQAGLATNVNLAKGKKR